MFIRWCYTLCLLSPAIILGWVLLKVTPPTYNEFMIMFMIVLMWLDIQKIKDKLNI